MVASTDIKFYVHTNTNAPQLQNSFGCMIDVLDACLVNGFGSQTVATLTASGTTVTATYGSAHNYLQYQVIKIAGATQTEYNGEHRILTVPNANTITFELGAVPSVTTATGTITSSLPSLGWLKPFSGTGKAAYRSANTLLASRPYLRVVDALDPAYTSTYAKYAKVGIVEDMSDIDTMFGVQAPYDAALPDKNWIGTGSGTSAINGWCKWFYALSGASTSNAAKTTSPSAGNRPFIIVGNKDYFYLLLTNQSSDTNFILNGFGNFESNLAIDNANNFLCAVNDYTSASTAVMSSAYSYISGANTATVTNSGVFVQRKYDQTTIAAQVVSMNLVAGFAVSTSGASNYMATVAQQGNVLLFPVFIMEADKVIRGKMRGLNWLYQFRPYSDKAVYAENNKMFLPVFTTLNGQQGQVVFDLGDL